MGSTVEVLNVTKRFRDAVALGNVSVKFEPGMIHGLIGRNGSGKTVLLKCICGFMSPSEGEVRIDGVPVSVGRAQDIGLIIEEPGFIDSMNALRNLKLLAAVRNVIGVDEIRDAISAVGLDPNSRKTVGKFSLGMRHRLGIAQAIMEKPPLLLLDEPMNGLDKEGVLEMRELFRRLRDGGTTILLASHYAEDIDELCDTVHEMDHGIITKLL